MVNEAVFVDTNIFLRYLTNDNPTVADKIDKYFKEAIHGSIRLITSELVVAEIVWVLESFYELPKEQIFEMISKIINTRGINVINSELLSDALDIYLEKNIDFVDAFNVSLMKKMKVKNVLTLDKKHFSRISNPEMIQL